MLRTHEDKRLSLAVKDPSAIVRVLLRGGHVSLLLVVVLLGNNVQILQDRLRHLAKGAGVHVAWLQRRTGLLRVALSARGRMNLLGLEDLLVLVDPPVVASHGLRR